MCSALALWMYVQVIPVVIMRSYSNDIEPQADEVHGSRGLVNLLYNDLPGLRFESGIGALTPHILINQILLVD